MREGTSMELRELQDHIKNLATIEKTAAPVVSCYVDVEAWRSGNGQSLQKALKAQSGGLSNEALSDLDEARARIEAFLGGDLLPQANGAAVFARAGDRPLFVPLQF